MTAPNLFLTYVTDTQRSTVFYCDLFDIEPTFTSPRYVAFEVAPGVLFAIWTGHNEHTTLETPRTSELGLMLPGGGDAIDEVYQQWVTKGIRVVKEPHDDVFGRTFVIADPDGNLIRVSPVDWHAAPSLSWRRAAARRHDSLSGKPCHTPTLPSPHATVSRWRSSSSTRDGRSARWPPAARPPGPL